MTMKILNGLDLAGQRIQSVADPTSAADAATKQYVDNFVNGLAWKDAVDAASTANIASLSSPGASIDGQTLTNGHRYLLKNQTTASQNGIYTYASAGTTLSRSVDMAAGVDARGFTVAVRGGTTNDDTTWNVTSDPAVVGTDGITWSQMSTGTAYTAGAGLTESPAFTFNVGAGLGITVNADDVALASSTAGNGLTYTSGVLDVGAGNGITVAADTVALASSVAGAGLTYTTGVLAIDATTGLTFSGNHLTVSSIVAFQETFSVGDGSSTAITLTLANIASRDAAVQVFQAATPWQQVFPDVTRPSTTTVTLTFAVAPTSGQYRCVVIGR
jgi:hypothetical protein